MRRFLLVVSLVLGSGCDANATDADAAIAMDASMLVDSGDTVDACASHVVCGGCEDGVRSGDESDVDCGGSCGGCGEGAACNEGGDCESGVCAGLVCLAPRCGDGVVHDGEACDDAGESAACDVDCTAAVCGDMVVNAAAGEGCDAGGETSACDADCTPATCGDATVNRSAEEQCDEGAPTASCGDDCACADFHRFDGSACVPNATVVDQYHSLAFAGGLYITPRQRIGQTFTIGTAGQLVGLEVDIYRRDTADPRFNAVIEVRNPSGVVVARHTMTDATVPAPHRALVRDTPGPTYVDLTADGLVVAAGQVWSFLVSEEGDDTCGTSGLCSSRQISCSSDADCGGEYLVATSGGYARGVLLCPDTCGGGTSPTEDLFFKTVVRPR